MTDTVKYEKSALRVWLLALLGVPLVLVGSDYFFSQRLIGRFGDLVYGTEEVPAFEPRDTILAILFIIVGLALIIWGLRELVFPSKVFVADEEGIRVAAAGPFRRPTLIPWASLIDVEYESITDDGRIRPGVRVKVADRTNLPDHPWGARWVGPTDLMIDATGWSPPADGLVEAVWQVRQTVALESSTETEEEE